jgi:hypothetical protein
MAVFVYREDKNDCGVKKNGTAALTKVKPM